MANQTIPGLTGITSPSSAGLLWISDPNASPQDRKFSLDALTSYLEGKGFKFLTTGSPYTVTAFQYHTIFVSATTNPYIMNLPQSSTCAGYRLRVVNYSGAATGLIKVVPYTGDAIGQLAANTEVYLQNVDGSGAPFAQSIELLSNGAGVWAVVSGQFCPHQTVDTDGAQYCLGKLHHLPLNNATNRVVGGAVFNINSSGTWYGSALTVAGLYGVPTGAKGIRARIKSSATATGTASGYFLLSFSDNNSNTPSEFTAHPAVTALHDVIAGGTLQGTGEIDIPLNNSGNFYAYATFANTTSVVILVTIVGYYMGD